MSSNMIKGYTLNYDRATIKRIDLSQKEEAITRKSEELRVHQEEILDSARKMGFIPGIAAEEIVDPTRPFIETYDTLERDVVEEDEDIPVLMSKADFEEVRQQIKEEVIPEAMAEAEERIRAQLMAEMETSSNDARQQADFIIAQAVEQAKVEAEQAREATLEIARRQGYEEGLKQAQEEARAAEESLESRKRELEGKYERQVADLEPAFVKILQEYLKKITGISYARYSEVFRYLLDRGINNAPKDSGFTVFLSANDFERFSEQFDAINDSYSDKLTLSFAQDSNLAEGTFRLENETTVIECGLEAELNGLLQSLELLA